MNEREKLEKQVKHLIKTAEISELVEDLNSHFEHKIGIQEVTVEKLNEEISSEEEIFTNEQLKQVVNEVLGRLHTRTYYTEVVL